MDELNHKFSVADIIKSTGGRLLNGCLSASFEDISTDSRNIKPGELFLALKGERFDGQRFIPQACDRGATGVVVKKGFSKEEVCIGNRAVIEVEDPLRALGDIAHYWRMKHLVKVVGVTGSNGKTTTKEMIGQIMGVTGNILKTEGNFNNLVGLPLTLLRLSEKDEVAILEMGTNARSEIKRLAEISVPDIAVITNIGQAHLEGLRSIEEVTEEKGDLFRALREDGFVIINKDDPRVLNVAAECKCKKISFGVVNKADLMAIDVSMSDQGRVGFRLSNGYKDVTVDLRICGTFNVYNALAAAGVAHALGAKLEIIREGLERFRHLPGRMEVIGSDRYTIINDTYNANPNSMEQALKTLVGMKGAGRTIAVLGDMLELGTFARLAHLRIGNLVSKLGVDYLFTLGQDSRHLARGALESRMNEQNIYVGEGHQELAARLKGIIGKGDYILVKGSRGMNMELIVEELLSDERKEGGENKRRGEEDTSCR